MNLLQFEKSPYLLQHKDNPVAWRPWGKEAFEAAKREDKPIFLSIGYSTCHWCHVMAHESFESEIVADELNKHFVCIKVDREERPDVDSVYMAACLAATGSGGWPLTVLMTPDQKPFWVGTYLKRNELTQLTQIAAHLWQTDRERLLQQSEALTEHLQSAQDARPGAPRRELAERGVRSFSIRFDERWGGFGHAPKFPMAHVLIFLMRYARLSGDEKAMRMAESTLEHMGRGGIFDHVGGGFSRYSTDGRWLAPHFEKMLYDNALLLLAYTEAFQQTGREWYKKIAQRTADYVLRELQDPMGGFYCGQDADSEGVEGKYYLFTTEELGSILGKDTLAFCRRFDVTSKGNFHGKSILNLIQTDDFENAPDWEPEAFRKVCDYRRNRTALHKDDKVLTSWNGLMIGAMGAAGLILKEPRWIEAAERSAAFIEANLRGTDGRLLARWRDGDAAHDAKLDDCAFYAWGLLTLYGVTFRTCYLEGAVSLGDLLLNEFFDSERGGFFPYSESGEHLLTRTKELDDGALPSGNSMAALVFSRLSRLTGEPRFQNAAEQQIRYLSGAIERHPSAYSVTLITLLETLWPTEELVVASRDGVPPALTAYLRAEHRQGLTVLVKTPETADALNRLAPFSANYPIPEQGAMYYRCHGGICEAPTDALYI